MGCDIHISIQRQEPDGTWREIVWQEEPYDFQGAPSAVDGIPIAPRVFRNRNYDLFGILANVRNGRGFAGTETGEGWPSIAPDRGWPDGFSESTVAPNPQYPTEGPRDMGDHSYTWVSLDELRAFDWDGTRTTLYGVVPARDYEALALSGATPSSYCSGVSGPGVRTYSPASYATALATDAVAADPYVRMQWVESARDATYDWPGKVIPWLESLEDGRPLRLVLGFDS